MKKKTKISLLVAGIIILTAAGVFGYRYHVQQQKEQIRIEQAQKKMKPDATVAGTHISKEEIKKNDTGKSKPKSQNANLPPIDATNKVLYQMRDAASAFANGVNYWECDAVVDKLLQVIKEYRDSYPDNTQINNELQPVVNNSADLILKWNLDLTGPGETEQYYQDIYQNGLVERHPSIATKARIGDAAVSTELVRFILLNDLYRSMQTASHNIVKIYHQ